MSYSEALAYLDALGVDAMKKLRSAAQMPSSRLNGRCQSRSLMKPGTKTGGDGAALLLR